MGNKMLIDAAHPEETRVVVLRGNRIEEFDFEAASKKQLRGNIYLAKVTRVEPSLQAAFIEYGGNRHGFLAFSEIHPDYYQIPVADRQQLLEDEARSHDEEEEEPRNGGSHGGHRRSRRHRRGGQGGAEKRAANGDEVVASHEVETGEDHGPAVAEETGVEASVSMEAAAAEPVDTEAGSEHTEQAAAPDSEGGSHADAEPSHEASHAEEHGDSSAAAHAPEHHAETAEVESDAEAGEDADNGDTEHGDSESGDGETHEDDVVEQLGGDALEDVPHRSSRPRRHYKIQEVIKRRQVLLVQVVKEERGNKGAALTTYLSLAGRYSVLMPNTARGGGISRKIVDPEDRKRLKAIAQELEVPDGMGIILRTAGASRGMPEVKRDFEYLMRMWETVRETTLKSSAPTLVYEEGSLIKRSIRDLFNKDVDEVVVSGDEAYREAKDFMRLLMPNQVRNVVKWSEPQPIFAKSGAEAQLDAMFSNQVTLKSGGYLVINQTEALVAIDVNSGRSTREHNIEDTALRTNLEAADEVARQLRLRDLAGLIVVDFIDMEEGRNDRAVERRIKEALKNDRARIQIGRISHFGLLEMSRQRMRTGVLEGSTVMCPHCAGSGMVRSMSSMALHVLRLLEDTLIRSAAYNLIARTRAEVAIYILNQKRANLLDLEARFGVSITVLADPAMSGMVYHAVERGGEATPPAFLPFRTDAKETLVEEDEEIEEFVGEESEEAAEPAEASEGPRAEGARPGETEAEGGRRRRRRRRRKGREFGRPAEGELALDNASGEGPEGEGNEDDDGETEGQTEALSDIESGFIPEGGAPETEEEGSFVATADASAHQPGDEHAAPSADAPTTPPAVEAEAAVVDVMTTEEPAAEDVAEAPRRRRTTRRTARAPTEGETAVSAAEEPAAPARRARRPRGRAAEPAFDLEGQSSEAAGDAPMAAAAGGMELPLLTPLSVAPAPATPAEPAPVAESAPQAEPVALVPAPEPEPEAPVDPDRPKRSGWWQRAKATFTAGS